jgi:hypothetical protein
MNASSESFRGWDLLALKRKCHCVRDARILKLDLRPENGEGP